MTSPAERPEIERVLCMLTALRAMRDGHCAGELRSAFNDAADRLDVLVSKLAQAARAGEERQ